ncbi:MAG: hypothetical protein QOE74_4296 [Mycobacterium sp.]|nr:hypothetical protein [Mycobacterium sp.]
MTGHLALLGIALAHRDGDRVGRVLVSLICYMVGAAIGARIARTPNPGDPVWPPAITRAMVSEAVLIIAYAATWWVLGAGADVYATGVLLGLGAIALGIQSSAMQRFDGMLGLITTFVSGAEMKLVGQLATGHRFRDIRHHLLVLAGLVCGCFIGALLMLHAPTFAPCTADRTGRRILCRRLGSPRVATGSRKWATCALSGHRDRISQQSSGLRCAAMIVIPSPPTTTVSHARGRGTLTADADVREAMVLAAPPRQRGWRHIARPAHPTPLARIQYLGAGQPRPVARVSTAGPASEQ